MATPTKLTRRAALAAGATACLGGVGWMEFRSLRGDFDHSRPAPGNRVPRADLSALGHRVAVQHVGHSTHLLRMGGATILTDPWFFLPAHGGMVHARGPALEVTELGALDLVLVTHEHPDHADLAALDRLDKRATVLAGTPQLAARIRSLGFAMVEDLAAFEGGEFAGLRVDAVPAVHDVPEVGYVVRGGGASLYFAGDTALHDHMEEIRERYAPDTAILPCDGTVLLGGQRWVMDPADAVEAARRLGVATVMPSHADARFTDPVLRFLATTLDDAAAQLERGLARGLPQVRCVAPMPGQTGGLA